MIFSVSSLSVGFVDLSSLKILVQLTRSLKIARQSLIVCVVSRLF